jgi:peptide/nickel transport system substrate-binding protein
MSVLATSEIDYINRVNLKMLGMLQRNPNIEIIEPTGYTPYTLPMNTTVALFDKANVRKAFRHAINRDEIVQKIFLGHTTFGNVNSIVPHHQIND